MKNGLFGCNWACQDPFKKRWVFLSGPPKSLHIMQWTWGLRVHCWPDICIFVFSVVNPLCAPPLTTTICAITEQTNQASGRAEHLGVWDSLTRWMSSESDPSQLRLSDFCLCNEVVTSIIQSEQRAPFRHRDVLLGNGRRANKNGKFYLRWFLVWQHFVSFVEETSSFLVILRLASDRSAWSLIRSQSSTWKPDSLLNLTPLSLQVCWMLSITDSWHH